MWARIWELAFLAALSDAAGFYSIITPKVLRPNRDFTVVVSTHWAEDIVRLTAQIDGIQKSGETLLNRQHGELRPYSSLTLKFEIGELGPGDYSLTVTGYGGLSFNQSTPLSYGQKSYSVFIQTDRDMYKPTDTINFRAVLVNPFLRPSVTGAIDVAVKDGDGNTVAQWDRVFTNKGVFSGKVKISDRPVLGYWNITVLVLGQLTSARILVANYILPKFEVEVLLDEYTTFMEQEVVATVTARYPYGKPVKGELTLQVSPTFKYDYLQAPYYNPISIVKNMNGKTDFSFNLAQDLKLKEDFIRELQFTAYIKEELTGRVQNATSFITIYRFAHDMEFITPSDTFKPGLKYTAFLKLSHHDSSPVRRGVVKIRHSFSANSGFIEDVQQVPSNGLVLLEFYPPFSKDTNQLKIEAEFHGQIRTLSNLKRARSPSDAFLQATVLTEFPKVGEEVLVGLNSTEPLINFVYEILGRGDSIYAQTLQAHRKNTHTFRFVANTAMAPKARLIVYYVKENGEFVADSLHFSVRGAIQNEVLIGMNPPVAAPGAEVAITVTTKPNSFVGISAKPIDRRNFIPEAKNIISKDGILSELESYDPVDDNPNPGLRNSRISSGRKNPTSTSSDVFKDAGVIIMTNGLTSDKYEAGFEPGVGPIDGSKVSGIDFGGHRSDGSGGVVFREQIRPPLAGPYAFSFIPPPPDNRPKIYLNKVLPPQWLFEDAQTRFNGVVTIQTKAPTSTAPYSLSAFAIDDFYGLGVSTNTAKLTIFRPFFISVHLPPSLLLGEATAVEVVVFNYARGTVQANVTVVNDGQFLFPDFQKQLSEGSPSSSRSQMVSVPQDTGIPVSFMIVPQVVGSITIKVLGFTPSQIDVVTKNLLVKPEGVPLVFNKAFLIDLNSATSFEETVNISTPRNIVEDSLEVSVSVVGDLLGNPVIDIDSDSDFDPLLELPMGCGEQNMAKMVPKIAILEYLKNKNELSEAFLTKTSKSLKLGYQNQLSFKHKNGAFSAFGEHRDKNGSTWITSFVLDSLISARRYIDVEDSILVDAAKWLISQQDVAGSFSENGFVNHQAMQGNSSNGIPLTVHALISLIKMKNAGTTFNPIRNSINLALQFLVNELGGMRDSYLLALTTYALHLGNHPFRDIGFYQLEAEAVVEDDMKWWKGEQVVPKTRETAVNSTATDIEITSYALLTYCLRGLATDALPILNWLTMQRNRNGGFQSTQDTAIGISALACIAKLLPSSRSPRLEIQIIAGERGSTILVNSNNARTLQKRIISNDTTSLMIKARGSGFAVLQVTHQFNIRVTAPQPSFSLDPQLDINSDKNRLSLTACTGYIGGNGSSNMVVMDVSLPSGYVVDNDLIPSLFTHSYIKEVEKKDHDSGLYLYFDSLSLNEVCPTISAYRISKVAFQKRAAVRVYDYYNPAWRARQFYNAPPASLCDICDLDECDPALCEKQILELNRQKQDPDFYYKEKENGSSQVTWRTSFIFLIVHIGLIWQQI